jgi:hypothetical protein
MIKGFHEVVQKKSVKKPFKVAKISDLKTNNPMAARVLVLP